jgi:hypothetical protein
MRTAFALVIGILVALPAGAQPARNSRFYAAATAAVDVGQRGNVPGGGVPSAGMLFGVRITPAWSVEAEIEQGFRTTSNTSEDFWVAYPPTPTANHEEFERYGIKARFDRSQKAGTGWSAHVMWRTREPGRVNAGFFGGVSSRFYESRVVRTTTFVSPLIDLPPTHSSVLGEDSTRRLNAGGFTGGLAILVRAAGRLTIAPEIRLTKGFITDDPYTVFKTGVRAMWSF